MCPASSLVLSTMNIVLRFQHSKFQQWYPCALSPPLPASSLPWYCLKAGGVWTARCARVAANPTTRGASSCVTSATSAITYTAWTLLWKASPRARGNANGGCQWQSGGVIPILLRCLEKCFATSCRCQRVCYPSNLVAKQVVVLKKGYVVRTIIPWKTSLEKSPWRICGSIMPTLLSAVHVTVENINQIWA